jgi:hypothetical protein
MQCPHCRKEIEEGATKCPHCTGNISYYDDPNVSGFLSNFIGTYIMLPIFLLSVLVTLVSIPGLIQWIGSNDYGLLTSIIAAIIVFGGEVLWLFVLSYIMAFFE